LLPALRLAARRAAPSGNKVAPEPHKDRDRDKDKAHPLPDGAAGTGAAAQDGDGHGTLAGPGVAVHVMVRRSVELLRGIGHIMGGGGGYDAPGGGGAVDGAAVLGKAQAVAPLDRSASFASGAGPAGASDAGLV
jgi:hypothetical protein